jgi:pre-mRNA-splicing factor SYF2
LPNPFRIDVRETKSRRRAYDPNEDVGYINDKNRDFNQKIGRAYDKYTTEIKESLERGTAL